MLLDLGCKISPAYRSMISNFLQFDWQIPLYNGNVWHFAILLQNQSQLTKDDYQKFCFDQQIPSTAGHDEQYMFRFISHPGWTLGLDEMLLDLSPLLVFCVSF